MQATSVAAHTATYSALHPYVRAALVNGAAGAVVMPKGRVSAVAGFIVAGGRIVEVDILADPRRLRELDLTFLD